MTTALLYPGQVLLEGTNLSEGRGTTLPFEVVGAPFIDPHRLWPANWPAAICRASPCGRSDLCPRSTNGAANAAAAWPCMSSNPKAVRSVAVTLHILVAVDPPLYPADFAWLPPPYEYEREKMPIDILFGSSRLREALLSESAASDATINELARLDEAAWWRRVQPYLLYD